MNQPSTPSSALIRATIFVRDIKRSVLFYRAIGLNDTYFEGSLDHPSATAVLGFLNHRPYSIHILKRPGPNYGMVGLFQLDPEMEADSLPPATGPARIGEVTLVFYVADIKAVCSQLRDLGATWLPEPQLFAMEHRSQLEVCLRDPDGVFINLVETDPAEQERTRPELDY
ncbi:VOC family protein [Sphingorhabdus sp. M41]|uniref:VOC family protein n=1 Tax=Sphingorhabdus sp. M41 TaxID=1806885 RepID=UPI00078B980A|nr:VOC family protein [Sphingorhabdus sp. M41]AMO72554.1 hypothetical protein AZE99_12460 [Sphingorhabdus sp. M41]